MLGQQYFDSICPGYSELSLLPYLSGSGCIQWENHSYPVRWEISLPITGKLALVLTTNRPFDPQLQVQPTDSKNLQTLTQWNFQGISDDNFWNIECHDVTIPRFKIECNASLFQCVLFCHTHEIVIKRNQPNKPVKYIVSHIWNLSEGKFDFAIEDRHFSIAPHGNIKNILELLQYEILTTSIVSTMTTELLVGESTSDDALKVIEEIEWLLSLITLNTTFAPVQQFLSENKDIVSWKIRSRYSFPMHNAGFLRNQHVPRAIQSFILQCGSKYLALDNKIDLKMLTSMMTNTVNETSIEFKIAGIILCFEFFLSKLLLLYGDIDADKLETMNIQTKLGSLNRHLRFIGSDLRNDSIRSVYRNPLFHQGALPNLTLEQKIETYNKYMELLLQIFLVIVGYTGEFVSPNGWSIQKSPSLPNGGDVPNF